VAAESVLGAIGRRQQWRAEQVAAMTPDEIAGVDHAREELADQQQERQIVHEGPRRSPQPKPPRPGLRERDPQRVMAERARQASRAIQEREHGGPSIGM